MTIRRLRAWLKLNKIFFETVAASALTVASLTIGFVQATLSYKQTALADLQERIAEVAILPTLRIYIEQRFDEKVQKYETFILHIENDGGYVSDFQADTFFILTVAGQHQQQPSFEYNPPVFFTTVVNDYYFRQPIRHTGKGPLMTAYLENNNSILTKLQFDAVADAGNKNSDWSSIVFTDKTYLHIAYKDLLKRPHEEYYDVAPIGLASQMTDDNGKGMFSLAQGLTKTPISKLTLAYVKSQLPHY